MHPTQQDWCKNVSKWQVCLYFVADLFVWPKTKPSNHTWSCGVLTWKSLARVGRDQEKSFSLFVIKPYIHTSNIDMRIWIGKYPFPWFIALSSQIAKYFHIWRRTHEWVNLLCLSSSVVTLLLFTLLISLLVMFPLTPLALQRHTLMDFSHLSLFSLQSTPQYRSPLLPHASIILIQPWCSA